MLLRFIYLAVLRGLRLCADPGFWSKIPVAQRPAVRDQLDQAASVLREALELYGPA